MSILVNDRSLLPAEGAGIATYLDQILHNWPESAKQQPVAYCTMRRGRKRRLAPHRPWVIQALADLKPPSPKLWWVHYAAWELERAVFDRGFRKEMSCGGHAAYFEPNNLAIRLDHPTVATLHDLSAIEHPQWHPRERVAIWESRIQQAVDQTHHWVTPSQFTRDRAVSILNLPPDQIQVIPEAARQLAYPGKQEIRNRLEMAGLPDRFVFCFGTLEPRKNLLTILDAYELLGDAWSQSYLLVIAGSVGWGPADWWRKLLGHPQAENVIYAGRITDDQAALLLAGAALVTVPSFYEGFGLQVVEAVAAGTPVACSDIPVFKEVAGTGAFFVAPEDVEAWATMIRRIIEKELDERVPQAHDPQVDQFGWQQAAEAHAELFDRYGN